jgi:hypothetical protein
MKSMEWVQNNVLRSLTLFGRDLILVLNLVNQVCSCNFICLSKPYLRGGNQDPPNCTGHLVHSLTLVAAEITDNHLLVKICQTIAMAFLMV